jgi:predicted metal-binding membrane protein
MSRPWPHLALKLSLTSILVLLTGFSLAAWRLTALHGADGMGTSLAPLLAREVHHEMVMSPMAAPVFLGMWITMMVAMMLPSVAPMVIAHSRVARQRRDRPLGTPAFVSGYLAVWAAVGLVAFAVYRVAALFGPSLSTAAAAVVGGLVFVAAGAYQLTPLKAACLSRCRTPLEFLFRWRPGVAGAARMGGEHGFYCLGCCWAVMLLLFVVGLANLTWMAVLAAAIFIEKVAPRGDLVGRILGVVLLVGGLAVIGWGTAAGAGVVG